MYKTFLLTWAAAQADDTLEGETCPSERKKRSTHDKQTWEQSHEGRGTEMETELGTTERAGQLRLTHTAAAIVVVPVCVRIKWIGESDRVKDA